MAVLKPGLVITRRPGESFVVTINNTNTKIDVKIEEVNGPKVRVRIVAPKEEVTIMRSELLKEKE